MSAAQARRLVERQIARNPSEIEMLRTELQETPGGGTKRVASTLPTQTMRIFLSSMKAENIVQEGGTFQVQRWGLLARWDADIQRDDEFTHDGRQFRVRSVLPVSKDGMRTGYQADLEEVK
jgi:hypothetical protein